MKEHPIAERLLLFFTMRRFWTNFLYLTTITAAGLLNVTALQLHERPAAEKLSSDPQTAFFLPMQITNRVFTDALFDPASEEYHTMYSQVTKLLKSIYGCPNVTMCPTQTFYKGVARMTFSSGSVIANATVVFNTSQIDRSVVHIYFTLNAKTSEPKTLQLNLDYTTEGKVIPTTVPPLTTTTYTTATTTQRTTTTTTAQPTTTSTTTTTTTPTTTTTTQPTTTTTTTTTPTTTTTTTTTHPPTTTTQPTPMTTITTTTTTATLLMTKKTTQLATTAKTITTTAPVTTTITHPVTTTTKVPTTTTIRANRHDSPADFPDISGKTLTPGWTLVLLVLASAILLLLIIIVIIMLVHWCCQSTNNHHLGSGDDPYSTKKTRLPKDHLPEYSTLPPPVSPYTSTEDPPKKPRTGFYSVNP